MFLELKPKRSWSDTGLIALIISVVAVLVLIVLDGLIKGRAFRDMAVSPGLNMLSTWVIDLRYFFEQGIYASTLFFVGSKFFETRTILTVGFDKMDASKISLKGPDENNVVWIGHSYATPLEAQTIAETLAERLKSSEAA